MVIVFKVKNMMKVENIKKNELNTKKSIGMEGLPKLFCIINAHWLWRLTIPAFQSEGVIELWNSHVREKVFLISFSIFCDDPTSPENTCELLCNFYLPGFQESTFSLSFDLFNCGKHTYS